MQVPSGILADTLWSKVSVTIGSLVAGIGSILFGLADDFAMASVGRFLVGLGVSVVFVGLMRSNAGNGSATGTTDASVASPCC